MVQFFEMTISNIKVGCKVRITLPSGNLFSLSKYSEFKLQVLIVIGIWLIRDIWIRIGSYLTMFLFLNLHTSFKLFYKIDLKLISLSSLRIISLVFLSYLFCRWVTRLGKSEVKKDYIILIWRFTETLIKPQLSELISAFKFYGPPI